MSQDHQSFSTSTRGGVVGGGYWFKCNKQFFFTLQNQASCPQKGALMIPKCDFFCSQTNVRVIDAALLRQEGKSRHSGRIVFHPKDKQEGVMEVSGEDVNNAL
ncbi:hypothetical protein AMECASPLE_008029 [Ameca splendens]|uniref:Uncharacterized protein n=1 Tax=Ameca splendens TaxID=208324 RepID=A0ABV0Z912_9TELE